MGKTVKMSFEGKSQLDRILIILKKENGPRASSAPALGLNTIIFKHVYWYMQQTQVSVYRTIGPLVSNSTKYHLMAYLLLTGNALTGQKLVWLSGSAIHLVLKRVTCSSSGFSRLSNETTQRSSLYDVSCGVGHNTQILFAIRVHDQDLSLFNCFFGIDALRPSQQLWPFWDFASTFQALHS